MTEAKAESAEFDNGSIEVDIDELDKEYLFPEIKRPWQSLTPGQGCGSKINIQ